MVRRNESRPEWPEGPRSLEAPVQSCPASQLVRAQMIGSQLVTSSRYQWAGNHMWPHAQIDQKDKNKSFKMKYVDEDKCISRKKLKPLFTVVGMQHGTATMENKY